MRPPGDITDDYGDITSMQAPSAGGGWTPGLLSPVLWLDSEYELTLTGSDVDAWGCHAGTGASLGYVGSKPIVDAAVVNGLDAVKFDTTTDTLVETGADKPDMRSKAGGHVWLVARFGATTPNTVMTYPPGASAVYGPTQAISHELYWHTSPTQHGRCAFSETTLFHVFEWRFDGAGSANADRLKAYIDGAEQTLTFTGTIPSTLSANAIGYQLGYSSYSNGWIAAVLVFDRVLSSGERVAVGQWLDARYGLTTTY